MLRRTWQEVGSDGSCTVVYTEDGEVEEVTIAIKVQFNLINLIDPGTLIVMDRTSRRSGSAHGHRNAPGRLWSWALLRMRR